jgi:hypothetical protein
MSQKITVKDNIEDLSVKYLYVKSWKWGTQQEHENFQGKPEAGDVCWSGYNNKTKSYRMMIGDKPFYIATLISPEEILAEYELVEITKDNILDLNIAEAELDKILKMKDRTFMNQEPQQNIVVKIDQEMLEMMRADEQRVEKAIDAFHYLLELNIDHFDILVELNEAMAEENLLEHDSLTQALSESEHGVGLNIGGTLAALSRYVGDDRRTNLNREDLITAAIGIVKELARLKINE